MTLVTLAKIVCSFDEVSPPLSRAVGAGGLVRVAAYEIELRAPARTR